MNSFPGFTSDERMNSGENATRFQHSTTFLPNFENLLNNADDYSRTLFVGDISLFCDEKSLYELFSPFGVIDSVQLKKCDGDMTKSHLSYGFVKFRTRESAEIALKEVNGVLFLGRNIRVGWAVDHPSRKSPFERFQEQTRRSTAQIHVTFASRHPTIPVTEASLRSLFSRFGDVVDVTIKKTLFNKVLEFLLIS
jgi:RNA recognition motif-containing protein